MEDERRPIVGVLDGMYERGELPKKDEEASSEVSESDQTGQVATNVVRIPYCEPWRGLVETSF